VGALPFSSLTDASLVLLGDPTYIGGVEAASDEDTNGGDPGYSDCRGVLVHERGLVRRKANVISGFVLSCVCFHTKYYLSGNYLVLKWSVRPTNAYTVFDVLSVD